MAEIKNKANEANGYKERFEFRLTVGNNIICQRYFKIANFNVESLRSFELMDVIRECADVIDHDLRDKTFIYLDIFSPRIFDSVEQMESYLADHDRTDEIGLSTGLVVRGSDTDYFMGKDGKAVPCSFKFDDGELSGNMPEDAATEYKFAFLIDGKEVCSTVWEGIYPKYVRNSIDLTNKRGKFDKEDIPFLTFEQYLLYRMSKDRSDLIWGLIKRICSVCSYSKADTDLYTTTSEYKGTVYTNKSRKFGFTLDMVQ